MARVSREPFASGINSAKKELHRVKQKSLVSRKPLRVDWLSLMLWGAQYETVGPHRCYASQQHSLDHENVTIVAVLSKRLLHSKAWSAPALTDSTPIPGTSKLVALRMACVSGRAFYGPRYRWTVAGWTHKAGTISKFPEWESGHFVSCLRRITHTG